MATAATSAGDSKRVQAVEKIRKLPPGHIRKLCETNFRLASDVLTYNWINGNDRAEWDGKPFEWHPTPDHYQSWYDQIRANDLNMFLAARKHTKTTFADCLMIWKSEYVAGHSSLYWANTETQVKERMKELEEIADANPWLENVHSDGAILSKTFGNGSRILTTWVTGAFEGGHVDLSLGDDPMKEMGDISDQQIESWYGQVIVPVVNPEGLHAIIGTRKRPKDLYYILRMKHENDPALQDLPNYTLTEYPAIREAWLNEYDRPGDLAPEHIYGPENSEETKVHAPRLAKALGIDSERLTILWPEARDTDFLARNLGGQGKPYFLREFCMIFTQAEDALVQRAWIDSTSHDTPTPATLTEPWYPADYPSAVSRNDFERVVVGVDPAGKGTDKFGFVTVGVLEHAHETLPDRYRALAFDDDGNPTSLKIRHILDVWQSVDVPPSRFRAKLSSLYDRYLPDTIAIEANLNQNWVVDDEEIPPNVSKVIEPITTTRAKHSWKDGVPGIASDIESGKYRWYTSGDENMTVELITAFTTIQYVDGELVGHTPDLVMAAYMTDRALSLDGDSINSSRGNMQHGRYTEADKEREESAREKRRQLNNSAIGRSILNNSGY